MKLIFSLLAALASIGIALAAVQNESAPPGRNPAPDETQPIKAIEQQWAEAVKHRDIQTIDRIQATEFRFTDPGGNVWSKTRAIESIKAGDLEIDSFEFSDVEVRLYDQTVVITFQITWNGRFRGTDISGPQRMTDVFVKREGRWQCVASHATRISKPPS